MLLQFLTIVYTAPMNHGPAALAAVGANVGQNDRQIMRHEARVTTGVAHLGFQVAFE
jgi:hypothetical protein